MSYFCEGVLNITGAQCSAIGESLVPSTTFSGSPYDGTMVTPPLQAATVALVFPTGDVPGSVPQFSNLPNCAVSAHSVCSFLYTIG